jgi:hypothetical protein
MIKLIDGIWEECGIIKKHHTIRCHWCKCSPSENHKEWCETRKKSLPEIRQFISFSKEDYSQKYNEEFEFILAIKKFLNS